MASEESLGKPVCADLSLGIATAPVLLAVQEVCVCCVYCGCMCVCVCVCVCVMAACVCVCV